MSSYIPSSGWAGSSSTGDGASYRFVVDRVYNAGTNKSTVSVGLQVMTPSGSGISDTYYVQGGSIAVGGETLQTFTANTDYPVTTVAGSWVDVKHGGSAKKWTKVITHNDDGSASVTFSMTNVMIYRYSGGDHKNQISGTKSETVSYSETRTFTLTISAGTGSTISVVRNGVALSNGSTLTYGDDLTISFAAQSGYELTSHTVNGSNFTSGGTHTVTGDVAVASTAQSVPSSGTVWIYDGGWKECQPYVYDGGWQKCEAWVYDGQWRKA